MPKDAKSILLVEDEAIISLMTKKILERNGYTVTSVSTGEQAILTMDQDPSIGMVLMDINLGDGIACLDQNGFPVVRG